MSYLRQVRGMLYQGKSLKEACNEIGVTEQIYHRWVKITERRRREREAMQLERNGYLAINLDGATAHPGN
jgi:hypothetical protein